MDKRLAHEIAHGERISSHAEYIWGWASPSGIARAKRRSDYFVKLGEINKDKNVLELGCGTGIFTKLVYDKTHARITAIDISDALLDKALTAIPDVKFEIENAMQLTYADESFDCVYGSSILHHLDFEKAVKEIFRVTKVGGRIVFAEPNMLNPQIFLQKNIPVLKKWMGDTPDERAIVRWQFKSLLHKQGFSEVKIFPYDFLHPFVPAFLITFVEKTGMILEKIPLLKEIAGSLMISAKK